MKKFSEFQKYIPNVYEKFLKFIRSDTVYMKVSDDKHREIGKIILEVFHRK